MTASFNQPLTYHDSGVNIEAGNDFVEAIKPLAETTKRKGQVGGLGGFGGLFDLKAAGYRDPVLVAATDGVGTKLKLALEEKQLQGIGIDLVAMCVNDLLVHGAEPLFFLDYFATSSLDIEQAKQIVSGIAEGCRQAGCGLLGGETAEMPGLYQPGDFDLAGFAVGACERDKLIRGTGIEAGDMLLGLASSGCHSNGFSMVRKILEGMTGGDQARASGWLPGEVNLSGSTFLTPTKIYVRSCLAAVQTGTVRALAHITGGGLVENLPRILPEHLLAEIDAGSWTLPPLFAFLRQAGSIEDNEMLKVFNCGIGMVLVLAPGQVETVRTLLADYGEETFVIGRIREKKADETGQIEFNNLKILFSR